MKPKTIIIGGGPSGSSAAIYLARFNYPVLLFDAPVELPGRTSLATGLDNYLGCEHRILGMDLLAKIREQRKKFPIEYREEVVNEVSQKDGGFEVTTREGNSYLSDFVVVAVGAEDKMPPIEIPDQFFDHSVFHCPTCDWYKNKDKLIALIGDDDHAISEALIFNYFNPDSFPVVIPADENFKFSPEMIAKAQNKKLKIFNVPIGKLVGENGYLQKIILKNKIEVAAEAIFTILGYERKDQFLDEGKIFPERDERDFILVDFYTFESSVSNLYAIGPCNQGPDQAIIAAGEGALAALAIHRKILEFVDL